MAKAKSSRKPARRAQQTMALKAKQPALRSSRAKSTKACNEPTTGFMVIIADDRERAYIERTQDPDALFHQLQAANASELTMICKAACSLESADRLQLRLYAANIRGSWYARTPAVRMIEARLPECVSA